VFELLRSSPFHAQNCGNSLATYIIENLLSTPLAAVDFSDGYIVANVPAHAVYALTVERSLTNGAIATTVSNTYVILNLSSVSAGPTTGSGTNLVLGYSQPAAPQTAVVEPLTLQPQTNPGMVSVMPYTATPSNDFSFQYAYGTPYVTGPDGPFPGAALPSSNTVSFQQRASSGVPVEGPVPQIRSVCRQVIFPGSHGRNRRTVSGPAVNRSSVARMRSRRG
jgi:hypothetical protein